MFADAPDCEVETVFVIFLKKETVRSGDGRENAVSGLALDNDCLHEEIVSARA
jgi:hypothetical protein